MTHRYHKHKEINSAIADAVANGWHWVPRKGRGHAVGILRCDKGHGEHTMSVWGSPEPPERHARDIRAFTSKCP